ncbi:hypothetical protein [Raoultella sp. C349492]|uniref:hypothetical protein n=1 Tax=Raoultella sp. C349492 TaxID=2970253 RepID=UPI0035C6EB19
MVIRLNYPHLDLNDLELLERIVEERQRGIHQAYFSRIKDAWTMRVIKYIEFGGNSEHIEKWEEMNDLSVHGRFKNLYLSPREQSVQKPLLEKLRNRELDYCPACGEDGTPNTLDHYLPKDIFPEFSVTLVNLFPMCDICQGAKSVKIKDEEGKRLFIHPYFDNFIEQQVLILDIHEPFNAPASIELYPHPDIDRELQGLISRHITELEIPVRYYRYFQSNYLRLLRLVGKMRHKDLNVREQLENFRDMALEKSINSWSYIFYDGVLRNEHLMEYLSNEELPMV